MKAEGREKRGILRNGEAFSETERGNAFQTLARSAAGRYNKGKKNAGRYNKGKKNAGRTPGRIGGTFYICLK